MREKLSRVWKVAIKTAVVYFVSALVFAAVYWVGWQITTDAFVLNEEFNRFPIEDLRRMWAGEIPPDRGGGYKISELYVKRREIEQRAANLDGKISALKEQLDTIMQSRRNAFEDLEKSIHNEKNYYKEKELAPFMAEEEIIEQKIAQAKENLRSSGPMPGVELLISEQGSALQELKIRRLSKEKEILDEFINNRSRFAAPELQAVFEELMGRERKLEKELEKNQWERGSIPGEMYRLWTESQEQKIHLLEFVDFIFFSMGVATTTTFGDLIPNSRWMRLMVIFQLTVSVVIVGIFVTALAEIVLKSAPESKNTRL